MFWRDETANHFQAIKKSCLCCSQFFNCRFNLNQFSDHRARPACRFIAQRRPSTCYVYWSLLASLGTLTHWEIHFSLYPIHSCLQISDVYWVHWLSLASVFFPGGRKCTSRNIKKRGCAWKSRQMAIIIELTWWLVGWNILEYEFSQFSPTKIPHPIPILDVCCCQPANLGGWRWPREHLRCHDRSEIRSTGECSRLSNDFTVTYNVGPPSYKLVYKRHYCN